MEKAEAFEREAIMRSTEYHLAIERAESMLAEYKARALPSTHLGHNLANVATDLSVAAGKFEAALAAASFLKG